MRDPEQRSQQVMPGALLPIALLVCMVAASVVDARPTAAQDTSEEFPSVVSEEETANGFEGGPANVVKARNFVDSRFLLRGRIQVNRIMGSRVEPVNYAEGYASCVGCSTFTVALQIDFYQRGAEIFVPQNGAVAVNVQCRQCHTVAVAFQYSIPVDDPRVAVDNDVDDLARQMERELRAIAAAGNAMSVEEADSRVNAVVERFVGLALSLSETRDEKVDEDSVTATPTALETVASSPTATAAATLSPGATATPTSSAGAPADATPTAVPGPAESTPTAAPEPDSSTGVAPAPTPTVDALDPGSPTPVASDAVPGPTASEPTPLMTATPGP